CLFWGTGPVFIPREQVSALNFKPEHLLRCYVAGEQHLHVLDLWIGGGNEDSSGLGNYVDGIGNNDQYVVNRAGDSRNQLEFSCVGQLVGNVELSLAGPDRVSEPVLITLSSRSQTGLERHATRDLSV